MKNCAHCGCENAEDAAKCSACGTAAFFDPIQPPLSTTANERRDADQLGMLSIFHFVVGGLSVFGVGFLVLHHALMSHVFVTMAQVKQTTKNASAQMPPAEFFQFFEWFYIIIGGLLLITFMLNILSGIFLRKRKYRIFSLVVAGMNCLHIPIGTILGVFTIMVLSRNSVRELYDKNSS